MAEYFTVDFQPIGKRVEVEEGSTLLEAARRAGVALTSECGGGGTCGQCRVIPRLDRAPRPTLTEEDQLSADELAGGVRLACQVEVDAAMRVDIPRFSLVTGQRLQFEAADSDRVMVDPLIVASAVKVPPATLQDLRPDIERVGDALRESGEATNLRAGARAVREVSYTLRASDWQGVAFMRTDRPSLIGFRPMGTRALGLAFDLGTTKIAGYLVELSSGQRLAAEGRPNPQIGYGEDLISRLGYAARRPGGAETLANAVHETLGELAASLLASATASPGDVADACVVGNTAMIHLLSLLPVAQLVSAPYIPATAASLEVPIHDLGLPGCGDAVCYLPPAIAGFVGSDHVAAVLASALDRADRTAILVDIGTNTEVALSRRGVVGTVSLSCASGPAFEGAHIRYGMRAASGAVEAVRIDGAGIELETIGDEPPVGICGSGILDAVAELRRAGAINGRGRLQPGAEHVRSGRDGLEFVLAGREQTGTGEDLVVTQKDIDEIQLAKGAIRAGIDALLAQTGVLLEQVDEIILAGAFGTYLNLSSAVASGLLPPLPLDRFRQVGNAAGEGAVQMLASRSARARAETLAARGSYIELTVTPGFRRRFASAMQLPDPE